MSLDIVYFLTVGKGPIGIVISYVKCHASHVPIILNSQKKGAAWNISFLILSGSRTAIMFHLFLFPLVTFSNSLLGSLLQPLQIPMLLFLSLSIETVSCSKLILTVVIQSSGSFLG